MEGVEKGLIQVSDINEHLISSCLYTNKSPDPDLLVRTSGEVRFSDFLLWQITNTQVYFADVLWPEFNIWDMLGAIFYYQRQLPKMIDVKNTQKALNEDLQTVNSRTGHFLNQLEEKRWNILESYVIV